MKRNCNRTPTKNRTRECGYEGDILHSKNATKQNPHYKVRSMNQPNLFSAHVVEVNSYRWKRNQRPILWKPIQPSKCSISVGWYFASTICEETIIACVSMRCQDVNVEHDKPVVSERSKIFRFISMLRNNFLLCFHEMPGCKCRTRRTSSQ